MSVKTYCVMYMEKMAATIDTVGRCRILQEDCLPYALYLEDTFASLHDEHYGSDLHDDNYNSDLADNISSQEVKEADVDILVNNITNFYFWCAKRLLTLDRQYAKEILNSIGLKQAVTDRDRAEITLSYHCLTLTDVYWVKEIDENISFMDINIYDNHLNNAFVDVSLRGKQMTVQNKSLIRDITTNGCFPKAWVRREGDFYLYKNGGSDAVEKEVLASRICQCFKCSQIIYNEGIYDGEKVSVSRIMTSKQYSIVSKEDFDIYAANHNINSMKYILNIDSYNFYMMNIIDYIVGNTDRHWENWGLLVDNEKNKPVGLYPLMDFNKAFSSYDNIDGANCQTVFPRIMTQREAAAEAVINIGLNQISDVEEEWFAGRQEEYKMLKKRIGILKEINKK